MKKLLPLLIILLTLSACNFPVQEGDLSQDPVVQTNVASILTQAALTTTEATVEFPIATETQAAEESPEATEEPVQTEEIEEPTAVPTEPPTEAPVPTATEVPTEAPTATALPTATPVPTETTAPTQSSGDDPWSGEPDLLEDFTYGTYWDFENDQFLSKVANGQLEFVSKGTPGGAVGIPPIRNTKTATLKPLLPCPNAPVRIASVWSSAGQKTMAITTWALLVMAPGALVNIPLIIKPMTSWLTSPQLP